MYRCPLWFVLGLAHGPMRRCCGSVVSVSSMLLLGLLSLSSLLGFLDPMEASPL